MLAFCAPLSADVLFGVILHDSDNEATAAKYPSHSPEKVFYRRYNRTGSRVLLSLRHRMTPTAHSVCALIFCA